MINGFSVYHSSSAENHFYMLSKNRVKYLRSLKLKKFRQKYNNFSVEGDKIVAELLQTENVEIESVIATPEWHNKYFNESLALQDNIEIVAPAELKKISNLNSASSVYAVVKQLNFDWEMAASRPSLDFLKNNFSLYLDGIQDPGNLGTILRIADWFGLPFVFCSEQCADLYNPKTLQASMGAFLRVKVVKVDFENLFEAYSTLPFYATVLDGKNIFEESNYENGIIVIGSEGKGVSENVLEKVSHRILIPKGKNGGAESLNAAVATGIVCSILTT